MRSTSIWLNSIAGAAIVALSVAVGLICASVPGQGKSRPVNRPALAAQANAFLGLKASTVTALDLTHVAPGEPLTVRVPIAGQWYTLELEPHSVRAKDFQLYEALPNGSLVAVDPGPERELRGTVLEERQSIVAGSLMDEGLYATIHLPTGDRYWIEPLWGRMPGAARDTHVIYHNDDVEEHSGVCGTTSAQIASLEDRPTDPEGVVAVGGNCPTLLACDADFLYFQRYGTSQAVGARIASVINTMNMQYDIEVDITHFITAIVVRTSAAGDPYSSTNAEILLEQFADEWASNLDFIPRNITHLFTGRDLDGLTFGIAFQRGVCATFLTDFRYGLVQSDFTEPFAWVTNLSAHELGGQDRQRARPDRAAARVRDGVPVEDAVGGLQGVVRWCSGTDGKPAKDGP